MGLAVAAAEPTPLRTDEGGVVRVGKTRVRLASVIYLHRQGETPEEIQAAFPPLSLADIYATIAYYLRHQEEVDAYLAEVEREAERIRSEYESRPEAQAFRQKLRARIQRLS